MVAAVSDTDTFQVCADAHPDAFQEINLPSYHALEDQDYTNPPHTCCEEQGQRRCFGSKFFCLFFFECLKMF